jgi:hypothetical protein
MQGFRFDPSKAVTFDLESGLVHLDGAPSRVLVPASALGALCAAAGAEAAAAFGRELGTAMGRRLASRFAASGAAAGGEPAAGEGAPDGSAGVRGATLEAVVDHLGGELALAGLGTLGIERWGRALVMVLDHCPLGPGSSGLLAAVLEGALGAATGRTARALLLDRDAVRARFLIGGGAAVDRVRAWLAGGASWGEALVKLHAAPRGDA